MPITVKFTDIGAKFENEQRNFLSIFANIEIQQLAEETAKVIKQSIKGSIQRPESTGNLANTFFAEKIGDANWGIGNISILNTQAPYWKWINYGVAGTGRTIPPISIGAFTPGSTAPDRNNFREGRFFQDSSALGGFLMVPQRPIEAHNYIEQTLSRIPSIIHLIFSKNKTI